jgi:hypothetical protein
VNIFVVLAIFAIIVLFGVQWAEAQAYRYIETDGDVRYSGYADSRTQSYEYQYSGSLSTSLHSGEPGTRVTVSGSGFPRRSIVTIYFDSVAVDTVTTDSDGEFRTTVRVPQLPNGLVPVSATGMNPYNPPTFVIEGSHDVHQSVGYPYHYQGMHGSYNSQSGSGYAYRDSSSPFDYHTPIYRNVPKTDDQIAALQARIATMRRELRDLEDQLDDWLDDR